MTVLAAKVRPNIKTLDCNSDRRKHGMGWGGRVSLVSNRRRRLTRHRRGPTESNRKRKLGGNSSDFRPYFTYWITTVQLLVLFISMLVYGCGPLGVDRYKKTGMVSESPYDFVYHLK